MNNKDRAEFDFAFSILDYLDYLCDSLDSIGLYFQENSEQYARLCEIRDSASEVVFNSITADKKLKTEKHSISICGEEYLITVESFFNNGSYITSDDIWEMIFSANTKELRDDLWKEFHQGE